MANRFNEVIVKITIPFYALWFVRVVVFFAQIFGTMIDPTDFVARENFVANISNFCAKVVCRCARFRHV